VIELLLPARRVILRRTMKAQFFDFLALCSVFLPLFEVWGGRLSISASAAARLRMSARHGYGG